MLTNISHEIVSKVKIGKNRFLLAWINELKLISTIIFNSKHIIQLTTFGDVRFLCSTRTEYFRTLRFGGEMMSLATFLFLLKKDDTVWDVGASVGLFTIHAAQRVKGVVAFEPDTETATRLKQNARLNGMQHMIEVRQLALGAEERQENLHTDGLSGFAPALGNLERHSASISVTVKTIDSVIQTGIKAPSVLKIDIEGAELLALQGARNFLRSQDRPRVIFVEIHPAFLPDYGSSSEEIFSLLRESGYAILSIEDRAEQQHLIALKI